MFSDDNENWGWEGQANAFTQVLTVVSLIFGGLSVVALLSASMQEEISWVLADVVAKWDSGLRLVLGPFGILLDQLARAVRTLGFEASIRPMWPHVLLVSVLVGLTGFSNARGWYWFSGAAWFLVCVVIGFVFLSGVGWSSFAFGGAITGFNLGARIAWVFLFVAAMLAVVVRVLLYASLDVLLIFVAKAGRLFGALRVALCFVGAALILASDGLGQMFLT